MGKINNVMNILLSILAAASCASINQWDVFNPPNPARGPQRAYHAAARLVVTLDTGELIPDWASVNAIAGQFMIVFGGVANLGDSSNDIWSFTDFSSTMFVLIEPTIGWKEFPPDSIAQGSPAEFWPAARAGHTLDTLSVNGTPVIVLFGGRGASREYFNDTWTWTYTNTILTPGYSTHWVRITSPTTPGPRWGAATLVHNNTLYLSGGAVELMATTFDVWAFTLQSPVSGTWTQLHLSAPTSNAPAPCIFHSFGFYHDAYDAAHFLVTGGWPATATNNQNLPPLPDIWTSLIPAAPSAGLTWVRAASPGPSTASGNTVSIYFNTLTPTLIVLRGINFSFSDSFSSVVFPVVSDAVNIFSPETMSFSVAPIASAEMVRDLPGSTIGLVAVPFGQEVVIHGGFNTYLSVMSNRAFRTILSCSGKIRLFVCVHM